MHISLDQREQTHYIIEAIWFLGAAIWVPTSIFGFAYALLLDLEFCMVYFKRAGPFPSGKHDCEVGGLSSKDGVIESLTDEDCYALMARAICTRTCSSLFMEVVIMVVFLGTGFIFGVSLKFIWGWMIV